MFTIGNQKYEWRSAGVTRRHQVPNTRFRINEDLVGFAPDWLEGNKWTIRKNLDVVGVVWLIGNQLKRYLRRNRDEKVRLDEIAEIKALRVFGQRG